MVRDRAHPAGFCRQLSQPPRFRSPRELANAFVIFRHAISRASSGHASKFTNLAEPKAILDAKFNDGKEVSA